MDMFDDDPVSCFLTNQSDGALPRGFRICDQPNTAIFSTVICVATFGIAVALRHFRNKKFFGKKVLYVHIHYNGVCIGNNTRKCIHFGISGAQRAHFTPTEASLQINLITRFQGGASSFPPVPP